MNTQRPPRHVSRAVPYGEVIGVDGGEIVCLERPNLLPSLYVKDLVDEIVMLRKLLRASLRGLKIQITDAEEFFRDKIKKAAVATGEHEEDVLAIIAPLMRQNLEEMLARPTRNAKLSDQVRGGVRPPGLPGEAHHRRGHPHDSRREFLRNSGPGQRPDRTQG